MGLGVETSLRHGPPSTPKEMSGQPLVAFWVLSQVKARKLENELQRLLDSRKDPTKSSKKERAAREALEQLEEPSPNPPPFDAERERVRRALLAIAPSDAAVPRAHRPHMRREPAPRGGDVHAGALRWTDRHVSAMKPGAVWRRCSGACRNSPLL